MQPGVIWFRMPAGRFSFVALIVKPDLNRDRQWDRSLVWWKVGAGFLSLSADSEGIQLSNACRVLLLFCIFIDHHHHVVARFCRLDLLRKLGPYLGVSGLGVGISAPLPAFPPPTLPLAGTRAPSRPPIFVLTSNPLAFALHMCIRPTRPLAAALPA